MYHTNLVSVRKIGFKPIQSQSTNPVQIFKFIQEREREKEGGGGVGWGGGGWVGGETMKN